MIGQCICSMSCWLSIFFHFSNGGMMRSLICLIIFQTGCYLAGFNHSGVKKNVSLNSKLLNCLRFEVVGIQHFPDLGLIGNCLPWVKLYSVCSILCCGFFLIIKQFFPLMEKGGDNFFGGGGCHWAWVCRWPTNLYYFCTIFTNTPLSCLGNLVLRLLHLFYLADDCIGDIILLLGFRNLFFTNLSVCWCSWLLKVTLNMFLLHCIW